MQFLEIELRNFFGYKAAKLNLHNRGLVLIDGSNQVGKSSLIAEAPVWGLYGETVREKVFGKTSREFKKDDVVNKAASMDCTVNIRFSIPTSEGINANGSTCIYGISRFRLDSRKGNTVTLNKWIGDRKIKLTGETNDETEDKILQLIGLNYNAFVNTFIFGQGPVRRFTQCTDADRRQILESFLQLDIFKTAAKFVALDLNESNKRISEIEKEKYGIEQTLRHLDDELATCNQRLENFDAQLTTSRSNVRKSELEKELQKTVNELKEHYDSLTELDDEEREFFKALLTPDKRKKLEEERTAVNNSLTEVQVKLADLRESLTSVEERLDTFQPGYECIECFREMTADDVENYKKTLKQNIATIKKDYKKYEARKGKLSEQLTSLKAALEDDDTIRNDYIDIKREHSDAQRQIAVFEKTRKALESELREFEQQDAADKSKRDNILSEIKKLKTQIKGYKKELTTKDKLFKKELKQKERFNFWMVGFSNKGIKDLIFKQNLDFLNAQISHYASLLLPHATISIDANLKVQLDIKNMAKSYIMSSGGQAKRIDLCIAMALQSLVEANGRKINMMVVDEFDSQLDQEGVNAFIELLRRELADRESIFVISHNPYFKDQFDKVITIEHVDGFSKIASH